MLELEVTGELPAWLTSTLVRSGPGRCTARPGGQVVARPTTDARSCRHEVGAVRDGDALLLDQLATPASARCASSCSQSCWGTGCGPPPGS